jgi:hypothetical protein
MTRRTMLLLSFAAAIGACEPTSDASVDPVWGKQPCSHCGMIVSDARYAAELAKADGTRAFFDDVGCMVTYARDLPAPPKHAWVHDADGGRWLNAEDARYTEGAHTPMDYGFIAHGTPTAGLTWAETRARVLSRAGARSEGGR